MGQWLATVAFPDGTRAYARYSTVVEVMFDELYPTFCPVGGTLPSGERCYRAEAVGEPAPRRPDAPLSPLDELVPVVICRDPDGQPWHALYCPRRASVLGPRSNHHMITLQDDFELVTGPAGVRHLRAAAMAAPPPLCGAAAAGDPLPFHREPHYLGMPPPTEPEPPQIDLFADWTTGTVCRRCLVAHPAGGLTAAAAVSAWTARAPSRCPRCR